MLLSFELLIKDITNIDIADILYCWQWRLGDMQAVVTITCLGDIFLMGIYWLQTNSGDLTKIADTMEMYQQHLTNEEKLDEWFMPLLVKNY